jgi:hypothetical protein
LPIDDERVRAYEQLMEAQNRIARRVTRAGATHDQIERAIELSESTHPEQLAPEEIYLGTLSRFVDALGGSLKLAAVFGDEEDDPASAQ